MTEINIRHATAADHGALVRLAALDSAEPPGGAALIAEAGSRMLAALPIGSGRAIADPFEPTAEAVALLELRAAQLADRGERSRRPIERLRELFRTPARA